MAPVSIKLKNRKDLKILEELEIEYTLGSFYELEGFTYVPSIDIYVAEEESPLRTNWYENNEALAEEGSRTPTILEFVTFLNYIKKKNLQLYEKIIQSREKNPWRIELFDAYFLRREDGLYVLTENRVNFEKTEEGLYVLNKKRKNAEKLENVLMKEKKFGVSFKWWLENPNPQGLPRLNIKKPESDGDKLIHVPPENRRIAGIEIGYDDFILDCTLDPFKIDTGPTYCVRAVKDGAKIREVEGIITPTI